MQTESSVDRRRRLDDAELGQFMRRMFELKRRIEEGSVDRIQALKDLQDIIEGTVVRRCSYEHLSGRTTFTRSPASRRKQSYAPIATRLAHSEQRLGLYEKNREQFPMIQYGEYTAEDIMAFMWEEENIPQPSINYGRVPLHAILDSDNLAPRDVAVIASTLQWLMTNVGSEFLRRVLLATKITI